MKIRRVTFDSPVFTAQELCARYRCAQVTIRRKEQTEGFPPGKKFGRDITYLKSSVYDWERKHMPHMQPEQPMDADDAEWDRRRRRYLLEKEEREAEKRYTPRAKKKKAA